MNENQSFYERIYPSQLTERALGTGKQQIDATPESRLCLNII